MRRDEGFTQHQLFCEKSGAGFTHASLFRRSGARFTQHRFSQLNSGAGFIQHHCSQLKSGAGFTLIESAVAISVVLIILLSLDAFRQDIFVLHRRLQGTLTAQNEARQVLQNLTAEFRSVSSASTGAYPIAEARADALTFYSDLDDDGLRERIRYIRDGTVLRKGTLVPTGNPLAYDDASERFKEVVHDVANGAGTPLFTYYGAVTEGFGLPPPLANPGANITDIRRIKVEIIIDRDPANPPGPVTLTTHVTPRNLRR